jgi:hypothetical protein
MMARSNFGQYKSGWEISVANSLHKAKIPFYYESPKFPVNHFFYTPDFFLSNLRICGKNIILEPHGLMQEKDIHKFELFKQTYGADFFLVLLTKNDVIPFVSKEAYDCIWPIEYSDLLMERIKSGHL